MKKKLILILSMMALIACALALTISAAKIYKTEGGETLFSYEQSNNRVTSYKGAFPKVDSEGNAIVWYLISTATEGENTICTVGSFKTLGEEGSIKGVLNEKGEYSISGIEGKKIVSINLPDNSGIKIINVDFNGGYTNTFPRDSQILFAYFPNTLEEYVSSSNAGGGAWKVQRLFQFTPIIECYFSDLDLTNENHMKGIGNFDFYGCQNLSKIVLPNGLESIYGDTNNNNGPAFYNCSSLKEIVIPNTVTSIGARTFDQCPSLEVIKLGANTNITNGMQLFYGDGNLKRIYLAANNITVGNGMFFNYAKNTVVFFTGSYDDYVKLKTALSATSNNSNFTGAEAVEYDSQYDDQYYADLAVSGGKWLVVYNYNLCNAFYEGHSWKGESNVMVDNYFEPIGIGDSCANCGMSDVKETIAPIFTWKGYSASTFGEGYSLVQGFYINQDAINDYLVYAPDFDYGILATVNKTGDAITPKVGDDNVLSGNFVKNANDYLDIKVTGIPADKVDALIVFCVYVTDGTKTYYLDNNATGETIVGITYTDVLNITND